MIAGLDKSEILPKSSAKVPALPLISEDHVDAAPDGAEKSEDGKYLTVH